MPYSLPTIAKKDKPFRVIRPNARDEAELLRLYTPILNAWRNSAATRMAVYAVATVEAMQEDDESAAAEIALLLLLIRFRDFFSGVETWHRGKWLASVANATGVDATFMTEAPAPSGNRLARRAAASQSGGVVAAATSSPYRTPVAAIPDITSAVENAVASAKASAQSLSADIRNRINQSILAGKRSGASGTTVARDINEGLAKAKARAARIAENELDNAIKAMTRARMAEAGLDYGKWEHNTRVNFRIVHKRRNGNIYKLNNPIWSDQYAPNCRCQAVPVLKLGGFSGI